MQPDPIQMQRRRRRLLTRLTPARAPLALDSRSSNRRIHVHSYRPGSAQMWWTFESASPPPPSRDRLNARRELQPSQSVICFSLEGDAFATNGVARILAIITVIATLRVLSS